MLVTPFVTRQCFHNHLILFINQPLSLMVALRAPEEQTDGSDSEFTRQAVGEGARMGRVWTSLPYFSLAVHLLGLFP